MRKLFWLWAAGLLLASVSYCFGAAAAGDNTRFLVGTWTGKATGPQGGPPTGDIEVTFERAGKGVSGRIVVKGSGGGQYSGVMSDIALKKGQFSATAVFKLGENPLEIQVSGPLKGRTIAGGFTVTAKGQKMGDGTFTITKKAPQK